jgi:hypothetical protein
MVLRDFPESVIITHTMMAHKLMLKTTVIIVILKRPLKYRLSKKSRLSSPEWWQHHKLTFSKNSKQKCVATGKCRAHASLDQNAHLHTVISSFYENHIFHRTTEPKNAKTFIHIYIAIMEIDVSFTMIKSPITSYQFKRTVTSRILTN